MNQQIDALSVGQSTSREVCMTERDVLMMRQVAYIISQSVCAVARLEAMKALNAERARHDLASAYSEADYERIPIDFGLTHNAVLTILQV